MKYVLLVYDENTANPPAEPDRAAWGQMIEEYGAYSRSLDESGARLAGEALQPNTTATSVRVRDGRTITTDGPFAETKEGLGGFYLIEAPDLDAALAWAAKCPGAKYGTIEVRPVVDLTQFA